MDMSLFLVQLLHGLQYGVLLFLVAAGLTEAQIAEAENLSRSLGKSAQTGAN